MTREITVVRSARFRDNLTLTAWWTLKQPQPEELDAQTYGILAEIGDATINILLVSPERDHSSTMEDGTIDTANR